MWGMKWVAKGTPALLGGGGGGVSPFSSAQGFAEGAARFGGMRFGSGTVVPPCCLLQPAVPQPWPRSGCLGNAEVSLWFCREAVALPQKFKGCQEGIWSPFLQA